MRAAQGGAVLFSSLTPNLTDVLLSVPDTFEPMVRGDTLLLLLDMCTVAGVEEDYVSLGLPIETSIDDQGTIVQNGTVTKPTRVDSEAFIGFLPVQICREIRRWYCILKRHPLIALDIVRQKVPAVAFGALTVLGVIVSVTPVHQHKSVVYNGTV